MIQCALLALLRQGPDYGYRLRHRFDREIGPAWCLNVGQVYQSLQTLQVKGLVRESTGTNAASDERGPRRNRRIYAITDKGERTLGGGPARAHAPATLARRPPAAPARRGRARRASVKYSRRASAHRDRLERARRPAPCG
jgi:hypothetical protein